MSGEIIRYTIEPEYKKSACEEQIWSNTINGKTVLVKVGNLYRWGSFYISLNDSQKEDLLKKDSVVINDYEDFELIEMWDGGCDFWVDIVNEDQYSETELEEINKLIYSWPEDNDNYEEDDESYDEEKMETNGWIETDCEYTLSSPYKLVKISENDK